MRLLLPLLVLLAACGGPSAEEPARAPATSGDEAPPSDAAPAPEEEEEVPIAVRHTTPVPVPLPAVPRDDLGEALQAVWTHVEEQVANARPDAPEALTIATVQEWADGPFREWLDARRAALVEERGLLEAVPAAPPHERAMALALWAYAFEDFGAQIAGAPVPPEIAEDRELLRMYIDSLSEASLPLGERTIELYADCQQRLAALGDDSPWLPWRAYCVQRGQEVIEGYGLRQGPEPDTF